MPIYEYQCKKCGHRFEKMQSHSAPAPACPKCGGEVGQLLSAPAVQFKGSGWYVTDYAKKSSAPAGKSESKGESKSESKSESKPAESKSEKPKSTPKKD
jgi:putative FmdB family regulatory protein